MAGEFKNNVYYRRKINPGDTTIEGRASNGMTLDNTGNVFIYSSQNQKVLNQLTSSNYNGSVEISPNTDNSFIGIISTSTDSLISNSPINIQMGATNYTTFNLETPSSNYIQAIPTSSLTSSTQPIITTGLAYTASLPLDETEEIQPIINRIKSNPGLIQSNLPVDEELEGVNILEEIEYSAIPTPDEGGLTVEQYKLFVQSRQGATNCKTSYPEFSFTEPRPSSQPMTYKFLKDYLKSKVNNEILRKSIFAIFVNESSRNSKKQIFNSAGDYNFTGIQTDSGRWGVSGISGQFCRRDSGGNLRAFAIFNSREEMIDFMISRATAKGFGSTDTADKFARLYLNTWVYLNLEKQNLSKFNQLFPVKKSIYNTAIREYNNTQ